MKPMAALHGGGTMGDPDLVREGQQRCIGDSSEMNLLQLSQPGNNSKSNLITYTPK